MLQNKRDHGADLGRWELATFLVTDRRLGIAMFAGGMVYFSLALLGINLMPCPFLQVTGMPCPGCGMSRSCMEALKGNFSEVLRQNPFGPIFALFWVVVGFGIILPMPWRKEFARRLGNFERRSRWLAWVTTGLAIYSLTRWFKLW